MTTVINIKAGLKIVPLLLWLLVLITAGIQVAQVHQHRSLLVQWQKLDRMCMDLMQEQTRLLLEISTLTALGRIDQRVRKQLNMTEATDIQMLQQ